MFLTQLNRYIKMVSKLSKRYLRHAEDSKDNAANKEHLEKFKREVISGVKKGNMRGNMRKSRIF